MVHCTRLDKMEKKKGKKDVNILGKVCYQLTGSSDFTLKSLLPVNWQQRIYVKIDTTS